MNLRRDANFPDNGFEGWGGYMQAKIAKLEKQFTVQARQGSSTISEIFNGVSIYVNGFTTPSADELKIIMSQHGGTYHTYKRSDDFIIASNLPDTKVKNMPLSRVVKPEWITESIKVGQLLDFRDFLLYGNSKTQPRLNFYKQGTINEESKQNVSESNIQLNISKNEPEIKNENISSLDNKSTIEIKEELQSILNTSPNKSDLKQPNTNNSYTKTAADPNFISEFYNNSRLHHISQLGACFKQHINDLRESNDFKFPARNELRAAVKGKGSNYSQSHFEGGRTIMHIDMDCFFVSVGLRVRPELRGKPIAVTHSKGGQPRMKRDGVDRSTEFNLYRQKQAKKLSKAAGLSHDEIIPEMIETRVDNIADENDKYGSMSEIASCSYEARAKGVKNGMFMGAALRLCPDIQTIPYDFEGYKEVAYTLYNTVSKYTLDIEAVSCDEMYVDCTELLKTLEVSVQDFASALREEIKYKTGCPCSTGFGGNRLQARLATKQAKPDGQFFLFSELVNDYMDNIKLKDLPGVGRQTSQKLETLGHQSCGSLQNLSLSILQKHLGTKTGQQLYDQCRGKDPNPLNYLTVRKSVSAEVNYGIRFENNEQCYDFLKQLSTEVNSRMTQFKVIGKCITLKLMVRNEEAPVETAKFMGHGFCNVINKSVSLNTATNDAAVICKEVISICHKLKIDPKEMRGIGIQITKLEPTVARPTKGAINKFLSTVKPTSSGNHEYKSSEDVSNMGSLELRENSLCIPTEAKSKTSTIKRKSPILKIKSQIKRRGRPPKSLSSKPLSSVAVKKSITTFFQEPQNDVFLNTKEENVRLPEASVCKPQETTKPEQPKGLLGFSWEKVRELLRAWLESGQAPLPCDIKLIMAYFREMIVKRDIDKLNILLNFLRRRIKELDSVIWKEMCEIIMEDVQNTMIAVYGKRLYIEK